MQCKKKILEMSEICDYLEYLLLKEQRKHFSMNKQFINWSMLKCDWNLFRRAITLADESGGFQCVLPPWIRHTLPGQASLCQLYCSRHLQVRPTLLRQHLGPGPLSALGHEGRHSVMLKATGMPLQDCLTVHTIYLHVYTFIYMWWFYLPHLRLTYDFFFQCHFLSIWTLSWSVYSLQVILCGKLVTSLLDMVNEVRALVKDLLPKPTGRPKAEAIPETPTVPDPTSSKSVVEGKDQLSHFKMVLNSSCFSSL